MLPRLGALEGVKAETTSLPREEYKSDSYRQSGLPAAPAIMIDDEIVTQGQDMTESHLLELLSTRLTRP